MINKLKLKNIATYTEETNIELKNFRVFDSKKIETDN